MVESHQALLVQKLLDGFPVLPVHQHLDTLSKERAADLSVFQPKNPFFPGHIGNIHQLLNARLGFRQLELEGAGSGFEGTQELGKAELGENNQQGTADNDQQGCGIDKYQRRGAKNNCRSNE